MDNEENLTHGSVVGADNPSCQKRMRRVVSFLAVSILLTVWSHGHAQWQDFVRRSSDTLMVNNRPFYFLGANAYYLMQSAANGDTASVKSVFAAAKALGMSVIRTWGFFDSADSVNPAVIQYRPGVFNELALRALDYVIHQAKLNGVRLIIPFVNSWDEYGGMNQYVRWRMQHATATLEKPVTRFSMQENERIVVGHRDQQYRFALSAQFGHDDFYRDSVIKRWYRGCLATILLRTNTVTRTVYKDEPAIMAWELANEPRSSDPTARLVTEWAHEMSLAVKALDPHHLVGTGEEGFDNTGAGYTSSAYRNQTWLFDGSEGVSFSANTALSGIDFGSIHLYPESWNLPNSAGNAWIRDHIQIARAVRKPLILGECGVRMLKSQTYESWLTTALADGAGGAMVWQLLDAKRPDTDGFGVRCPEQVRECATLTASAMQFERKSREGRLPSPDRFVLLPNYPNPFNAQTTVAYALPVAANVVLAVYNVSGQEVARIVEGFQAAGLRRELFDARDVASGAYFYRLSTPEFSATGKLLITK